MRSYNGSKDTTLNPPLLSFYNTLIEIFLETLVLNKRMCGIVLFYIYEYVFFWQVVSFLSLQAFGFQFKIL